MANKSKSAKKRVRQDVKRRLRNKSVLSSLKTKLKAYKTSLANQSDDREELLRKVISAYHKAASKGVIHKRNASRNISRISKLS
ncbi:30S ribosomal protein S20 [bacterium]|nr:30S ribosomal protein S20 [bacterium]|tara:strand:- start:3229 stop:3480 length:252 start_codon:yes stop_codon:yes gene_type:complete